MSFYKKEISSKNIKNTIFIDWNNSKILKFKKQDNIDILYTPVVFDKQNRRMKSFVGSITNDKNKIESNLFALFYDETSTNEQFSGFISQSDINGNLLKIYKYIDGVKQLTYSVSKKNKNKSNTASKSDCEPTWQELLQIIDMMIQGGGGTYYSLECVTVTGLLDGSNSGGGGGLEPDSNLSGGYIPLGDSYYNLYPTIGGTNTNPPSTSTIEQWWSEETNILSIEIAVSISIIEAIPTLTQVQKDWVSNPINSNLAIELLNFINANLNSLEAQNFAKEAIEALIRGEYVDFEETYIETETPDDGYTYTGTKQLIPNPLTLSNGDQVSLQFGTTKSDNKNANQEVSIDLIASIKNAIEQANYKLSASEKITSIYIMATTNGKHSPTSNHSNGTAIDISRINGIKMSLSGVTNQITELQKGFDGFIWIRENFGPAFKHKYYNSNGTWDLNYNIGGHKDHIHVSIRK